MVESVPIHVAEIGSVVATVYRIDRFQPEYCVSVKSRDSGGPLFFPDELPMFGEAVRQAEMFIRYQEQIARMNWCPGCGNG